MDAWPTLLGLGMIIAAANAVQTMTGFGATILALTLGALLVPIAPLKLVLIVLNIPLCGISVWRHRDQLERKLLLHMIAPWMALGLALGMIASPYLGGRTLQVVLGVMVTTLAIRDLLQLLVWPTFAMRPWWPSGWVVGAGFIQGILASGGPLLVRALTKVNIDRGRFRTSLLLVWLVANVLLLLQALWMENLTGDIAKVALWMSPSVIVGIWIGEYFHHRVSERQFAIVVQFALAISGMALLLR